ncbi:Ribosomal RNA small subunit methyltransferase A [bacterium HR34]|nr:Ribosomal RNA small subunit methyltransferase A [bacterium HR34]
MDLYSPKTIKHVLKEIKAAPLKTFGQNFLINKAIVEKMISFVDCDTVIEVGGGLGQISLPLSHKTKKLIIIEKDKAFCDFLRKLFQKNKNVYIIEDDCLEVLKNLNQVAEKYKIGGDFEIVGNLPYNIATKIIELSLLASPTPKSIIATTQKEVAQRIVAKPPKMNYLACKVQYLAKPKILLYISKNNFWPKPKIDSAILKITPKKNIEKLKKDYTSFIDFAKILYSHPRKTIRHNLKLSKMNIKIEENFLKKRAEQIQIQDLINLWENTQE